MACPKIFIAFCFIAIAPVYVMTGECCKAHYDLLLNYKEEKWCDDYCCYQFSKYDCCSNFLLQAPATERRDFCPAYFTDNAWAAVLISIGCVVVFVGTCVFICKVCCGGTRVTGTTIMPGANPGVTVVNSQNTVAMQQQPVYPAHQPPSYPAVQPAQY